MLVLGSIFGIFKYGHFSTESSFLFSSTIPNLLPFPGPNKIEFLVLHDVSVYLEESHSVLKIKTSDSGLNISLYSLLIIFAIILYSVLCSNESILKITILLLILSIDNFY